MTKFDPTFALEVIKRRQAEVNRRASEIHLEKYKLQVDGRIFYWGPDGDAFDKRIHALWAEADTYDGPIAYLEERIWDEKTFEEKVWATLDQLGFAPSGPDLVVDVLEARDMVLGGYRPF